MVAVTQVRIMVAAFLFQTPVNNIFAKQLRSKKIVNLGRLYHFLLQEKFFLWQILKINFSSPYNFPNAGMHRWF